MQYLHGEIAKDRQLGYLILLRDIDVTVGRKDNDENLGKYGNTMLVNIFLKNFDILYIR